MSAKWIHNKKLELTSIKQLERALMNRPDMRAALNRYIANLDLQGQINRNAITEQQAIALLNRALQQFSYTLNRKINLHFTPAFFDVNDLTNPLNMANAINNPNSLASTLLNDTADAIINAINTESDESEQTQNQQQMVNQQTAQEEMQTQTAPIPTPEPASHEKEELLVGAVLGVSFGKEAIEHIFEKYIGKELKNELKEPEELEEIKSPFKIPTLKPEPPKTGDK